MREYSFVEAAKKLGVSMTVIYKWEKRWKFTHDRRYIMSRERIYTDADITKLSRFHEELIKARRARTEADLIPFKAALEALGGVYANSESSPDGDSLLA
jgi:hypothetical protein